MEVWIDDEGRMRRQRFEQQGVDMTMDLYDFGTRESVKAPPASETKDVSEQVADEVERASRGRARRSAAAWAGRRRRASW
jgi:hypothetical protein